MSLMSRIKTMFGFASATDDDVHAMKLAEYDRRHDEQEERLDAARVAVLEGRFRTRYGSAAEQELREQMQSGNTYPS